MNDTELYQLLEDNHYKATEANLSILKEGLESGKYQIVNFDDILTEMMDHYQDDEYFANLCEAYDLTDEEVDMLMEGIFHNLGKKFKKGIYRLKGYDEDTQKTLLQNYDDRYNQKVRAKIYKSLGKEEKAAAKTSNKANIAWAKANDKRQEKRLSIAQGNGLTGKEREASIENAKNIKKVAETILKDAKAKKGDDRRKINTTVAARISADSEEARNRINARNNELADKMAKDPTAGVAKDKTPAEKPSIKKTHITGEVSAQAKDQGKTTNKTPATPVNASVEYSDYDLYQILEANSYKTTAKNLAILKEGLESGRYSISEEE